MEVPRLDMIPSLGAMGHMRAPPEPLEPLPGDASMINSRDSSLRRLGLLETAPGETRAMHTREDSVRSLGRSSKNKITSPRVPEDCGPLHERLLMTTEERLSRVVGQEVHRALQLHLEHQPRWQQAKPSTAGAQLYWTAGQHQRLAETGAVPSGSSGPPQLARQTLGADSSLDGALRQVAEVHRQKLTDLQDLVSKLGALLKRANSSIDPDGSRETHAELSECADQKANLQEDVEQQLNDLRVLGYLKADDMTRSAPASDRQPCDEPASVASGEAASEGDSEEVADKAPPPNVTGTSTEAKKSTDSSVYAQASIQSAPSGPFQWEWERSNGRGWQAYRRSENNRIEWAWRNGASRVRLRSGDDAKVPMQIYFVDMIQEDPISLKTRRVRRQGDEEWWRTPKRNLLALINSVQTGERRWESYDQYKRRQRSCEVEDCMGMRKTMTDITNDSTRLRTFTQDGKGVFSIVRDVSAWFVNTDIFWLATILCTLAQAIWIGVEADRHDNVVLYKRPSFSIVVDCLFTAFFIIELTMRMISFEPMRRCCKDAWFRFDAACVCVGVVDVCVAPTLDYLLGGHLRDSAADYLFRNLGLLRALRVCHVFGLFSDAGPFFKGLLSGLGDAAFIWGLLVALLFVFSLLLRVNCDEGLEEKYFYSVWGAMLTLTVRGVMLDEINEVVDDIITMQDVFAFIVFSTFVFLAHFNLLNMLIGAFCSVAVDSAAVEKEACQMRYLRKNLNSVLDCYIAEEGLIGKTQFELIMMNTDFHDILRKCGTDMDELNLLDTLLFHRKTAIDFETLFKSIVHLRKGKAATVKDIMSLRNSLTTTNDLQASRR